MSTEKDASDSSQSPKDLAIFLGGSSKKHNYLREHFKKYSKKPIKCQNLYTKHCHKYGHQTYTHHFKTQNLNIVAICPLMDSLIPFTDAMNKVWGLPHNDTSTSQIRRNKALMHQTIRDKSNNNIRYAPYFLINDYLTDKAAFEAKMKQNKLIYPIIIKPPTSGGTDGVRLCYTFCAAQRVIIRNLNEKNGEGHNNTSMMAQEFLDGEEYVVNTVSYDYNHKIADVWRAYKSFHVDKTKKTDKEQNDEDKEDDDDKLYPFSILYDYQEFEREIIKNEKMQLIVKYVEDVLDTLGVKYGCGHCEVMYLSKEKRVCLIELNARMHGALPRATNLVSYDQMSILALSHCDAQRFLTEIPKYYDLKEDEDKKEDKMTVKAIFLRSKVNGKMNINKLIELKTLKTFKAFARTLFDGVKYWLEYKAEIKLCLEKLSEIEDASDKEEYLKKLNQSLEIVDRIEKVEKTIDLLSCPGTIVLEGKIKDINHDYNVIRALEDDLENGLFITEQKEV